MGYDVDLDRLIKYGNFPEPFLLENSIETERWRQQYVDSLLRVDVRDFEDISNLRAMQLVFDLLKRKVGPPISYSSIAKDVGVSVNTVKKYIQILEALYKEVGFVLVDNDEVIQLIEAKLRNSEIDKSLYYFHIKYNLPAVQIVKSLKQERRNGQIEVVKVISYLKNLKLFMPV